MAAFYAFTPPATPTFPDVPTDYWAYREIEFAHANGIVMGYIDNTFRPEDVITRDEMAVFLCRAMGAPSVGDWTDVFSDVPTSFWAAVQIYSLVEALGASAVQWSPGLFNPSGYMTNHTAGPGFRRAWAPQGTHARYRSACLGLPLVL